MLLIILNGQGFRITFSLIKDRLFKPGYGFRLILLHNNSGKFTFIFQTANVGIILYLNVVNFLIIDDMKIFSLNNLRIC